eukprot:2959524-Pleurochrysis_carterae.AAC.1
MEPNIITFVPASTMNDRAAAARKAARVVRGDDETAATTQRARTTRSLKGHGRRRSRDGEHHRRDGGHRREEGQSDAHKLAQSVTFHLYGA